GEASVRGGDLHPGGARRGSSMAGQRTENHVRVGPGSVIAIPPNAMHQFFNTSQELVVFMGVTTAPRVINAAYDLSLVFDNDQQLVDLYAAPDNYFRAPEARTTESWYREVIIHTNFIADARAIALDDMKQKVAGGQVTDYRMGRRFPHGHISSW